MVELLYKCLKQPEANVDLFHFCEDAFLQLDTSSEEITANFPLYFSLQLAPFFGFQLQDNYSEKRNVFSLKEGKFFTKESVAPDHLNKEISYYISQLLKAIHPADLIEIKMNRNIRSSILKSLESYYAWHIAEFGQMKTLTVLHEVI
jgi:DNA repair protein RecO (recombination protein O)